MERKIWGEATGLHLVWNPLLIAKDDGPYVLD